MAFNPRSGAEPHRPVFADALNSGLRVGKYMQLGLGGSNPLILQHGTQTAPVTVPTLPTAVQDNVDTIVVPHMYGNQCVEMYQTTAQTLMPSRHATKGLEIALDQVDNESVEYVLGGNTATNPLGFTSGTDAAIYLEATFEIPDASGMDQFGIFMRKQENYVVPTSFLSGGDALYTDFVLFGFAAAKADPNPLGISYDFNNSGSSTVFVPNFTWSDNSIHRLAMFINARYVKFEINGVPLGGRVTKDALGATITAQSTLTPPAAIRFDSGDFIIPGIFVRQDTDVTPVYLRSLLCAQLLEIGRSPSSRNAQ